MRSVLCVLTSICVLLGPTGQSFVHTAIAAPVPTIVIGEIAWAGSSLSTADEWIELWNVTDHALSTSGLIVKGAGENGKLIPLSPASTIPAHGTLLISNYDSGDAKSTLAISPNVVTTTMSLSNAQLSIELDDGNGNIIDRAGTGQTPFAGASGTPKTTMIRKAPDLDGTVAESWISATTTQQYKIGVSDLGTPGICDSCFLSMPISDPPVDTPTDATTTPSTPPPIITQEEQTSSTDPVTTTTTTSPEPSPIIEDPIFPMMEEAISPVEGATTTSADMPNVSATSTDAVTPEEVTTSSTPIISTPETTTTTDATSTEFASSTEQTPPALQNTADNASQPTAQNTNQSSTTLVSAQAPPTPAYGMLRLNEIFPTPQKGDKEWVEIGTLDTSQSITLTGCTLHDGHGRILTFTNSAIISPTHPYLTINLSSAHLNNGGDVVSLYDPQGSLIDTMNYGKTSDTESWIRFPNFQGPWIRTTAPTPGAANLQPQPPPTLIPTTQSSKTPSETPTPSAQAPSNHPTITETAQPSSQGDEQPRQAPQRKIVEPRTTSSSKISEPLSSPTSSKKQKPKTPKPKTATTSTQRATRPPISLSLDMLTTHIPTATRVRLHGVVATPPGLLTRHAFVLHAPDGRGLLVTVPSSIKLPLFQDAVQVSGTVRFNDQNIPYLNLTTKDQWIIERTIPTSTSPRIVDLVAPATEDAWSLVHVTGTVQHVSNTGITLDLGDATIHVAIRPVVGYRTKRLLIGDVVAVRGVIDTRGTVPELYPRAVDDISLIEHAAPKTDTSPNGRISSANNWTPIGAAAGAIAATEGAKRLRRKIRDRRLQKKHQDLERALS